MSTPRQEDIDRSARELYDRDHHCGACHGLVSLADQLGGRCPHCGALIMAGPIMPDRAAAMLAELKARRVALGLSNP
jgi:hypothetical protein